MNNRSSSSQARPAKKDTPEPFLWLIRKKYLWLGISGALVGISLILLAVFGLNLGIDFTGGSLSEIRFTTPQERPSIEAMQPIGNAAIQEVLQDPAASVRLQPAADASYVLRTVTLDESQHKALLSALDTRLEPVFTEARFESIGPTIGDELKRRSVYAGIAVLIAIVAFIAYAFRGVGSQLKAWKLGLVAVAALVHDVAIVLGTFAVLGRFAGVEIDTLFVTAVLLVLGYSVNDTIVVFDRVRKVIQSSTTSDFAVVLARSMKQTLVRSLNTSLTTFVVLLALALSGGESLRWFIVALLVGVVAGTYSSIFFAAPLLAAWKKA